jgi:O-antigen/teichoic acid export membrane protein
LPKGSPGKIDRDYCNVQTGTLPQEGLLRVPLSMEEQIVTQVRPTPLRLTAVGWRLRGLLRTPLYVNALYLWAGAAVQATSGFIFWAVAATIYSAHDVGLGSASVAAVTLLAMLANLGLGAGLIRFLPEAGDGAPRLMNAGFSASGLLAGAGALVFLAGLSFWSPELHFLRDEPIYLLAFVLFCVSFTVQGVQDQAFVGLRAAKYVLTRSLLINVVRMGLLVVLAIALGPFGIVAAAGLASLLGLAYAFGRVRRMQPDYRVAVVLDRKPVMALLPFALGNYIADASLTAPGLVLPIMVVNVLDPESGAHFYIAWFLSQILAAVPVYLALSLFAEGTHNRKDLPRLVRNALLPALVITGVGVGIVFLLGDKVLLVFGADYSEQATGLLRILALAAVPGVLTSVYLGTARIRKQIHGLITVAALVTVVTLAGSYVLLPRMGIAGAGFAALVGQGVGAALAVALLVRGRLWPSLAAIRGGGA